MKIESIEIWQQVGHSIILIDEVDLNLHPPVAQNFVRQLNCISPSSQFILTSHSEAVSNVISEDEIYHFAGSTV